MFTGIVEEIGSVRAYSKDINGASLTIECKTVLDDVKIGDSIMVDGVCETVTDFGADYFKVRISDETLNVTTFSSLKSGEKVNLERALKLNSRLGGHIVSGHADCVGKLVKSEKLTDFYNMYFEIPREQMKYVVYKGSIAVNGISITVAGVNENGFKAAVIPHTYQNTGLKNLKIGSLVNIETDILGKYVEKMLSAKNNKNGIDMAFLEENGYV